MLRIPFHKMHGAGNDFILIDHRAPIISEAEKVTFARCVCARHTGIGADGLIFIETDSAHDFAWDFLNADGSAADMCGNGARCAARFAHTLGIAQPDMTFRSRIGTVRAICSPDDQQVRVYLPDVACPVSVPPLELPPALCDMGEMYFVNSGVPHAIIVCAEAIDDWELLPIGVAVRHHPHFAPAGANVDLMTREGESHIAMRTFERGVEGETLACGTGAVACALVGAAHYGISSPVQVRTRSGETLTVEFSVSTHTVTEISLTGSAALVYTGLLSWS